MFRVVVHLKDGSSVAGKSEPVTQNDIDAFKKVMEEMASGTGGWQVNLEGDNGSWAIFPKDSVLWVELERTADE